MCISKYIQKYNIKKIFWSDKARSSCIFTFMKRKHFVENMF